MKTWKISSRFNMFKYADKTDMLGMLRYGLDAHK